MPKPVTRYDAADNRRAAALVGSRTFRGQPCRAAGHDGTRYTSTGACVECMGERYRRQRAAALQDAGEGPEERAGLELIN